MIGDPTVAGWLTVILYLVTSVSCWILARELGTGGMDRRAWRSISILFLFLGINKQLDLQTALTEVVPPRGSSHWPYNSWLPLELDSGNGRNWFGASGESVAPDSRCRMKRNRSRGGS
jgi:hypothetical protein